MRTGGAGASRLQVEYAEVWRGALNTEGRWAGDGGHTKARVHDWRGGRGDSWPFFAKSNFFCHTPCEREATDAQRKAPRHLTAEFCSVRKCTLCDSGTFFLPFWFAVGTALGRSRLGLPPAPFLTVGPRHAVDESASAGHQADGVRLVHGAGSPGAHRGAHAHL